MKVFGVLALICIAVVVLPAASADGPCGKIDLYSRHGPTGTVKTCHMDATVIDSKDFSITTDRDETIERFYAWNNIKIEYLPTNIGAKFPNSLVLSVTSCSIKEVKKENFEGLSKLLWLELWNNRIEKIDDDTFEFIPAVEKIQLVHNKIKRINGRAFVSLHKLKNVWLGNNECINEDFKTAAMIAEMSRIVTEKCGFAVECNIEAFLSEKAKLEADLKTQLEEISSLKSRIEHLEIEKTQIESLHNESKAQLLLVSVAAFVTVAILLGITVAIIKKRQASSDRVAFINSN